MIIYVEYLHNIQYNIEKTPTKLSIFTLQPIYLCNPTKLNPFNSTRADVTFNWKTTRRNIANSQLGWWKKKETKKTQINEKLPQTFKVQENKDRKRILRLVSWAIQYNMYIQKSIPREIEN